LLAGHDLILEEPLAADAGDISQLFPHIFDLVASEEYLINLELLIKKNSSLRLFTVELAACLDTTQTLLEALGVISKQQVDGAFVYIKI
jgi:hypothetical protein